MLSAAANAADVYTDFSGFGGLRKLARKDESKALPQVAKQFEALFLQMMLKSMRKASFGDPLFGSQQGDMYRDLYDQQLALSMSQADSERGGHGLGLAAMLERQLSKTLPHTSKSAKQGSVSALNATHPTPAAQPLRPPVRQSWSAAVQAVNMSAPLSSAAPGIDVNTRVGEGVDAVQASTPAAQTPRPDSPEAFVRQLWPQAQRAARELGTRPEVLLAQAALETGWGQGIIQDGHGSNSHNLFNIKADHRWDGKRMQVNTLEYEDGVAVRRRAAFRAYGSYEASFRDYVNFLRNNPRYQDALRQAHDPKAFIHALDAAGYATDPNYAAKVWRVMHSSPLQETVAELTSQPMVDAGGDSIHAAPNGGAASHAVLKNVQDGTLS